MFSSPCPHATANSAIAWRRQSATAAHTGQWLVAAFCANSYSRPVDGCRPRWPMDASVVTLNQPAASVVLLPICSLAQKHSPGVFPLLSGSTQSFFSLATPHLQPPPPLPPRRPFFHLRPAGTSSGPNASRCPPSMAPFFPKSREQSLPSPSVQTLPGSSRSPPQLPQRRPPLP